ncbi:MAG: sigma 54-interacting transcriptional regulator [Bacillota bacterium]
MAASFPKTAYLEQVVDLMKVGLIVVDAGGFIRVYNQRAKEIFCMAPPGGPSHPAGRAQKGDIVLFADSALGGDDGGLVPADLALLGVNPASILPGSPVVAVGRIGAPVGNARWASGPGEIMEVETSLCGLDLKAVLNTTTKSMSLFVGGHPYEYRYYNCAAHLVLLDSEGSLKFYQARGYTARREAAKEVLLGVAYRGKGDHATQLQAEGRHLLEVHPEGRGIQRLLEVAQGRASAIYEREYDINGFPVRCTVLPLKHHETVSGGMLLVEDISEIRSLHKQRDQAVQFARQLEVRLQSDEAGDAPFAQIIGRSESLLQATALARSCASTNSTVLLTGESGTGKNLFAWAIHQSSPRRDGPFVQVNCAAIPEPLLESELFGYEHGAFTGASRRGKPGKFELAHGGTVFLDEVGDLSPALQAKILDFLQDRTVVRVGGLRPRTIDARVVAATNQDLAQAVSRGTFREDLYYRLHVVTILLPPLRERRGDTDLLVDYLLPRVAQRTGRKVQGISASARQLLRSYRWPGNIRELENVLEQAVNMCTGIITDEHLPPALRHPAQSAANVVVYGAGPLKEVLEQAERQAIKQALQACDGDRNQASRLLRISRSSFYAKLRDLES